MGTTKSHIPVKLFSGFIFSEQPVLARAVASLRKRFGPPDLESPAIDFLHTSYYEKEFGPGLKKKFISFGKLVPAGALLRAKLFTNALESRSARDGRRLINIDPGYLTLPKVVLATTKDFCHRIYMDKGIYEEVTLVFRGGSFQPWEWTYPDFRTPEYIAFFNQLRSIYARQIS